MKPRLQQKYEEEIIPRLIKEFSYRNVMQVPRLAKITVNMGIGEASRDIKLLDSAVEEIKTITGQKPIITRARRSIAAFKLRAGMPIGVMVTLRRARMWEFLDRLLSIAMPRVRDFKGLSRKAFDGKGNYAMGIREQIIFPEIEYDQIDRIKGMNVCLTTTAKNDDEAYALLRYLGVPFRN
ncbi:MAG: 50S ribosomal protein L5 [Bradymonadales bacterium]|nr:50S ribosomal protein L5 [Bradymonadales bacterium]